MAHQVGRLFSSNYHGDPQPPHIFLPCDPSRVRFGAQHDLCVGITTYNSGAIHSICTCQCHLPLDIDSKAWSAWAALDLKYQAEAFRLGLVTSETHRSPTPPAPPIVPANPPPGSPGSRP